MEGLRETHSRHHTSRDTTVSVQRQHGYITTSRRGIDRSANQHGRDSVIANAELPSPWLEPVEDLFVVTRAPSCRLGRPRRYEKALKDELTGSSR